MIATLRFTGPIPPAIVFIIALTAAVAVAAYYFRETQSLGGPLRWLLPLLRAAVVSLVIITLAAPLWHHRQVIGTLGRVVFSVDVSQSMGLNDTADVSSQSTRLRRAVELLAGDGATGGWIDQLEGTHRLEVVAFSEGSPSIVWSSDRDGSGNPLRSLEPDGDSTDLASGYSMPWLFAAASQSPSGGNEPTAVVMLTDGRDNSGDADLEAAAKLAAISIPLHAVGFGAEEEPADIAVLSVTHPESVSVEGQLAGEVVLKLFGMRGRKVLVRVESMDVPLWQETVEVRSDGEQVVPFQFPVEPLVDRLREGTSHRVQRNSVVLDLAAVAEPHPGELSPENNRRGFRVAASTRQRRMLILDGSSRWEFRYIKNLFDRDPRWSVDSILFGEGTDSPELVLGREPGQFPETREAMARYDVVVLGEVPIAQIGEEGIYRLQELITRGGGLVVIDGRYGRVREMVDGPLAEVIPVRYLEGETRTAVAAIRPTRVGLDQPIMNLFGPAVESESVWQELPAPRTAGRVVATEDAEVWAEAIGVDGREHPWLVTRLFGSGRVFYLSAGETWRWRYKVADRFHARFWNQLLGAVIQPPYSASDDFLAVGTDRIEYDPGSRAGVRVRLQGADGGPVGDATVDAVLRSNDQVVATVPLAVDDPARGTYIGTTGPLSAGRYDVGVRASGFDAAALRASTPIWVRPDSGVELHRVSLDRDGLVELTAAAGGQFFHESSADDLLDSLRPLSSGRVVESDHAIWQSPFWFAAIILICAIEWLLRKSAGLL